MKAHLLLEIGAGPIAGQPVSDSSGKRETHMLHRSAEWTNKLLPCCGTGANAHDIDILCREPSSPQDLQFAPRNAIRDSRNPRVHPGRSQLRRMDRSITSLDLLRRDTAGVNLSTSDSQPFEDVMGVSPDPGNGAELRLTSLESPPILWIPAHTPTHLSRSARRPRRPSPYLRSALPRARGCFARPA